MKNKKAQQDIISMVAVFFAIVVVLGIIWFAFNEINTDMRADEDLGEHVDHLDQVDASFRIANWGPVAIFVAMFISLLISYYRIGSEPYWFFIHLIILIIVVICSGSLANYYYELSIDPDLGTTFLTNMSLPAKILYRYPLLTTIIGFVSLVVLVTKWVSSRGQKSSSSFVGVLPGYG